MLQNRPGGSLFKAILVSIVASVSVPLLGSLAFSICLALFFWFYGFVAAVLFFPMSFLMTLPAAVWFGIRTYLASWFSRGEAAGAVAVSATIMFLLLNSDSVLGVNALPTIEGAGSAIARLTILLVGLAFASVGAVATQILLAKTSLIQDRKTDITDDDGQFRPGGG